VIDDRKPSWRLDDAAMIAAQNPYTFYKPSADAVALLRPGNLVKLIFAFESDDPAAPRAERMWVRIDRIEGERFYGVLDNDPRYIRDLKDTDAVEFDARHIIQTDVEDPRGDPTARYWPRCFVTKRVLEEGAPVGYLYREPPDGADDSGWRIMVGDESDEYMDDSRNIAYVSLGAVLRQDDSFRDLLDTPAPCAYWRDAATGKFDATEPPTPTE
jgi:hypothetical protein